MRKQVTHRKIIQRGSILIEGIIALPLVLLMYSGIIGYFFVFKEYDVAVNSSYFSAKYTLKHAANNVFYCGAKNCEEENSISCIAKKAADYYLHKYSSDKDLWISETSIAEQNITKDDDIYVILHIKITNDPSRRFCKYCFLNLFQNFKKNFTYNVYLKKTDGAGNYTIGDNSDVSCI